MCSSSGALAQPGEARVALAQVAVDAYDEGDEQRRIQREAQQQAQHEGAGQAARMVERDIQRPVVQPQAGEAQAGHRHQHPGEARLQQHRAQDHLQQEQEGERVGRAAAQVELGREHAHVHQQRHQQLHVQHRAVVAHAQHAHQVEGHQAVQRREHMLQRQPDAEAEVHGGDGGDLADDGDPAQLDQLLHVLVADGVVQAGHPGAGRVQLPRDRLSGGGHLRCGECRHAPHSRCAARTTRR